MLIKFSLVDDDASARQMLRLGLESIAGFTCTGSYASGASALAGIPRAPGDVVLMAVGMPGMSGIECTRRLHTVLPQLPIVMLTHCGDDPTIYQALMAGASGYLSKPARPRACAQAIRKVLQGRAPLCWKATRALVRVLHQSSTAGPEVGLSERERELMTCLYQRLADKEIAQLMGIGLATVRSHMRSLFDKLKVKTRADAVSKYLSGAIAS